MKTFRNFSFRLFLIFFSLGMGLGIGSFNIALAVPVGDDVGLPPADDEFPPDPVRLQLQATYFDPVILSGPLSFGLSSLPSEVDAFFQFLDVDLPFLAETNTPEILSAQLVFGDATFTTLNAAFPLSLIPMPFGPPSALTYRFNSIDTATTVGIIVMNSSPQLNITGVDRATNQAFQYRYQNSVLSLSPAPVPEPGTLLLLGTGLLGLIAFNFRRQKQLV